MKTITAPWDYQQTICLTTAQIAAANAQIDRNMAICEIEQQSPLRYRPIGETKKILKSYKSLLAQYRQAHPNCDDLGDYRWAVAELRKLYPPQEK